MIFDGGFVVGEKLGSTRLVDSNAHFMGPEMLQAFKLRFDLEEISVKFSYLFVFNSRPI